jgi:hypothetical protein
MSALLRGVVLASLVACAASKGDAPAAGETLIPGFLPPAAGPNETRIFGPLVKGIAPGADITWCSYIKSPFDTEVDVLNSRGYQSHSGHHALLMDVPGSESRLGVSHECNDDDMTNARFLAGGSDGAAKFKIPEGIAFRLPKSSVLMVQSHWINTGSTPVDGQSVFNIATAKPSAARQPAQLFATYTAKVSLPPKAKTHVVTECTFPKDLDFFALGGHAHEWGSHIKITHKHGDEAKTLYDMDWEPAFQSDPPLNYYETKAPLRIAKGDTLRLECDYGNTTGEEIHFPREMCVLEGFYFPGSVDIQCADGRWLEP